MRPTQPSWRAIEDAAVEQVMDAVRAVLAGAPEERVYGVMFHEFYGDGTYLYWPCVTVGTDESLLAASDGEADEDLRWSGPDLVHTFEPNATASALAERVAADAASRGSFDAWELVYDRFLRCFPRAAKRARRRLIDEGLAGRHVIVVAMDEDGDLIPLSLTKAQLRRHFPEFDELERTRRWLADSGVEERVAYLVPRALQHCAPLFGEADQLLVELGEDAVPAVAAALSGPEATRAAMLLAELNHDSPEAIVGLTALLLDAAADVNARSWAAAALARLDRSQVIVDHVVDLTPEIVGRGLGGPYRSFRDRGRHRPLDYAPLEAALAAHPEAGPWVAEELSPGVGFCAISAEEVQAAREGLTSGWDFIRHHADSVLDWYRERTGREA